MNEREKIVYQISIWLEEGNNFKKMWEEFKEEYKHKPIIREYYDNLVPKPQRFIGRMMEGYEKKYFPKTKGE